MPSHAKLSPSAAERWMTCPGSIRLCESLAVGSGPSSRYAAEGTHAHAVRERLLSGDRATDLVGWTATYDGFEVTCTDEMLAYLRPGVEHLREYSRLWVEVRIPLQKWIPGGFGTADTVAIDGRTLVVNDLKYGQGQPVSAEWNRQLMIYALGALHLLESDDRVDSVRLEIDQPRVAGGFSYWTLSKAALLEFGDKVRIAADTALRPGAPFAPSDSACRWCPARSQCPALAGHVVELLDNTSPWQPPSVLSAEQRSRLLEARPLIERWLDSLYAQATDDAAAGRPVPGFKLVEGKRGNRQWADEEAARAALVASLGERAWNKKLISPSQAEKMLGKGADIPVTYQSPGTTSLVPVSDRRPAVESAASFEDLVALGATKAAWE